MRDIDRGAVSAQTMCFADSFHTIVEKAEM